MSDNSIPFLIQRVQHELTRDIIPFWVRHSMDPVNGGFIGRMSNDLVVDTDASKGLVLNARLLWSFSSIHRFMPNPTCLKLAQRAFAYLLAHFWDTQHGGAFWTLHPDGRPLNTSKKSYGQAFLIYALAEFYLCTGKVEALDKARELFGLLEKHAFDPVHRGYCEVYNQDWTLSDDQRLGSEDMNEKKSMNNHLHLLEAFTNLYRVWKHPQVAARLRMLIDLFCDTLISADSGHLVLFFDETWKPKSNSISYGHDIETSWLLCEAARVLGNARLFKKTEQLSIRMAQAVYEQAIDSRGGLYYETDPAGHLNRNKDFWCQAEAAVGFLNAYQLTQKQHFFDAAVSMWNFIEKVQLDKENGEWYSLIDPDNQPIAGAPKVSEWKDPYHNTRCCIELIGRLSSLMKTHVQDKEKEISVHESR